MVLASLKEQAVTPTPSALGVDLLNNLEQNKRKKEFTKVGESILTEEDFRNLQNISDEHELIVALTSHFERIFNGFAVVNSEVFPWLFTGHGHAQQKPDLFVCPVSFYKKRIPKDSDTKQYPDQYRYGVVEDKRLYDGVVLLDCKLSCTSEAFGQLSIHLAHLGQNQKGPTRGMLFSRREFWLYEQERGVPLSFTSGQWNEKGSIQAIRSFFDKTLGHFRHIDYLCDAMNVRVLDPKFDGYESGFLGQGAFGRVIRVLLKADGSTRARQRDVFAMKLVQKTEDNFRELRREHRRLQEHSTDCGCCLIASPTSDFAETSELCGFVMAPVGSATCTRQMVFEKKNPSLKEVLMALNALHRHEPHSILHGDPRLPNLIITSKGLTWIDLRHGELSAGSNISAGEFALDMNILIVSLFPSLKTRVDKYLRDIIDSYGANPNPESIGALDDYLQLNADRLSEV